MDFQAAVNAHVEWKLKLRSYINNPDKSLAAVKVGMDNQCVLGQWIYGEGAKFSSMPEYGTLKAEHAKFHKCAGTIVTKADQGKKDEAMNDLNTGEYHATSNSVVQAITAIRNKAK